MSGSPAHVPFSRKYIGFVGLTAIANTPAFATLIRVVHAPDPGKQRSRRGAYTHSPAQLMPRCVKLIAGAEA